MWVLDFALCLPFLSANATTTDDDDLLEQYSFAVCSCILNSLYIYTESKLLRRTLADADALAEVLVFEFSSTSVAIVAIAIVGISSSIIEVIKVA